MLINELKDVLHRIRVRLHRNNLPRAKGGYYARPASEAELSIEQVAAALETRGGFTGNRHDLTAYARQFFEEMAYQLCDGFAVNTGWFSVRPVIGGLFETENEGFDPKKHKVGFRFRTGRRLRGLAESVEIEVEDGAGGWIDCFTDLETGLVNETVTPGGFFRAGGRKIKVAGGGPECGVWFASTESPPRRYKVERALLENVSTGVSGLVPALPAGEYVVEVVTCYTVGGIELKTPKAVKSGFTVRANNK